jgi:hypothetical protein
MYISGRVFLNNQFENFRCYHRLHLRAEMVGVHINRVYLNAEHGREVYTMRLHQEWKSDRLPVQQQVCYALCQQHDREGDDQLFSSTLLESKIESWNLSKDLTHGLPMPSLGLTVRTRVADGGQLHGVDTGLDQPPANLTFHD